MRNPNDATIDIPLTTVQTNATTGARKADGYTFRPSQDSPDQFSNEKSGFQRTETGLGRRKKLEARGLRAKDADDGTLNTMGKIYYKILHFSIVTRYFLYVLPLALAIAVPIVIGATVAGDTTIAGVQLTWFFVWIEVVWLGLWISKLFAQALPWVFQFLCGIVSSGTRKYALILKALELPISFVGWAAISVATFTPLMTQNPYAKDHLDIKAGPWVGTVRNVLFAILFSSLVFLIEKLLIQLISISYHRKQFDLKIKDSKRNVYLLSLLYEASRNLFPAYCPEFAAEDCLISDSLDAASPAGKGSGSATPMRLIQNVGAGVGRVGDKLTAAFGNVAQEITGKQVFNPTAAHNIVVEALEKTSSSEALARRIWMSFVMEGREALFKDDILDVLGPDRTVEAEECFGSLDQDGNGDISLDEMILTVCEFGRERHSIANSMHDVDQAIHVLDNLLMIVAFILMIFIFVAFFNKNFTTTLATAGTALLSLSFVFAVTCQEVLGSCIFLFVKHPFDVGDRVDIDTNQLVVERISLLFTIFRKVNDHKTTQVPNIVLNTKWIENISRSKAMREQLLIFVNFDTTLEDIQLLKNEMTTFVTDKENNRDFQPDVDIEVTGIHEMNKMELKIEIRHKSNWSNEGVRAARRSKFMCALVLALRKIPIYGPACGDALLGDVGKPTYAVTVSPEQAATQREEFADKKNKKRMVPKVDEDKEKSKDAADEKKDEEVMGLSTAVDYLGGATKRGSPTAEAKEAMMMESLNSRPVGLDPAHDDTNEYYKATDDLSLGQTDSRRSHDLEEVRGLLRKESSRGRRKPTITAAASVQPPTTVDEGITPPPRSASRPGATAGADYHEYMYASPPQTSQPAQQAANLPRRQASLNNPMAGQRSGRPSGELSRRPLPGSNPNTWRPQGP